MRKEQVVHNGELQAIVLYNSPIEPGVHFYNKDGDSLQMGKQLRAKGETIKPHKHGVVEVKRNSVLKEVLYVEKGKVEVVFYDEKWKQMDSRILNQGDLIMMMTGAHGFNFLEETQLIEIKEGPYNPRATVRMTEGE